MISSLLFSVHPSILDLRSVQSITARLFPFHAFAREAEEDVKERNEEGKNEKQETPPASKL